VITARHPEWPAMKRWLDEQIAELHRQLEQVRPEQETNALRGEIAAYRKIIDKADPKRTDGPAPTYA